MDLDVLCAQVQQDGADEVAEKNDAESSIIVLSSPLALDGDYSTGSNGGAPNLMQRVFSLFKNIRPGSDLTSFQLPPQFNIPKSQLQCYGEAIYCVSNDLLHQCNSGKTPLDRIASVVAWSISTARPLMFGFAPYNPILGETHHGSRGTLNVLVEQVSHHPPVSALHATDEKENVEVIICEHQVPKFYGTSIEAEPKGKRILNLLSHGESYVLNSPKLSIKFLPVPNVEWVGTVRVHCVESGLEAEYAFKGSSVLTRKENQKMINGKIFESSTQKTICEIIGHWDRTVSVKSVEHGNQNIIYNAKESISTLKTPTVKHPSVC
uniref:Oxysterol-binding protein n=1 Tax=Kalanchoe fedtschenkoi TaxID=63787 RepID=A0A7N0R903_KALFE